MSDGIRVASVDEVGIGEAIQIPKDVTGTEDNIAIVRDENGWCWAINDTCTHQTASLSKGYVEDGDIECPIHASKFSLRTGEVTGFPATIPTKVHRVEVREGDIYLYPGEHPNNL